MLEMIYKKGYDYRSIRNPEGVVAMFPFSSERKKMTTIYRDGNNLYIFSKGAPEYMLDSCSFFYAKDGNIVPITPKFRDIVKAIVSQLANKSLRTLIIAYKHFPEDHPTVRKQLSVLKSSKSSRRESDRKENPIFNENPKELVLIAIVGIKDPLREGIREAVAQCQTAGVTVRMLTGDNKETAMAIAKEAGIIPRQIDLSRNPYVAMEGREFREFVGGLVN